MSILEPNKIDIVATRPDTSTVKLIITDHLRWDDIDTHSRLIQDKVNTYLEFVESGQLSRLETPKTPPVPEVQIVLVVQHEPSNDARVFLDRVSAFLAGRGIVFEVLQRSAGPEPSS